MRQTVSRSSLIKAALIAGSALATPVAAFAQSAPADVAEASGDEIIITGFRQSLEKALNVKRESVDRGEVEARVQFSVLMVQL